jgi:hypothetical protein
VTWKNEDLAADELSIYHFEHYKATDYGLAHAPFSSMELTIYQLLFCLHMQKFVVICSLLHWVYNCTVYSCCFLCCQGVVVQERSGLLEMNRYTILFLLKM